ncbi:hypothetical protein OPT61_g2304 [Boeremia exigua]|uniref:Uncharacterized protein n=1 Tax=Boeremia exigua TaxID=749465 RepID=A0ACC2IM85_9PLEO|nr:hypothetical protein OPT61_g2304 [Boeremia exigua]
MAASRKHWSAEQSRSSQHTSEGRFEESLAPRAPFYTTQFEVPGIAGSDASNIPYGYGVAFTDQDQNEQMLIHVDHENNPSSIVNMNVFAFGQADHTPPGGPGPGSAPPRQQLPTSTDRMQADIFGMGAHSDYRVNPCLEGGDTPVVQSRDSTHFDMDGCCRTPCFPILGGCINPCLLESNAYHEIPGGYDVVVTKNMPWGPQQHYSCQIPSESPVVHGEDILPQPATNTSLNPRFQGFSEPPWVSSATMPLGHGNYPKQDVEASDGLHLGLASMDETCLKLPDGKCPSTTRSAPDEMMHMDDALSPTPSDISTSASDVPDVVSEIVEVLPSGGTCPDGVLIRKSPKAWSVIGSGPSNDS